MNEMDDEIDLRELFFRLLSKWYWFLLFGVVGLFGGYIVSKSIQPSYKVNSILLIQKETQGAGVNKLFEGFDMGDKTNIENHILMLKSYSLNRNALENLNWTVSWFREGIFSDESLYGKYPYFVEQNASSTNLTGVFLHVTPISDIAYRLEVEGVGKLGEMESEVEIDAEGIFGVPFGNQYFNFTISRNSDFDFAKEDDYYFQFNDPNVLTKTYIKKLEVVLATKDADGINLSLVGSVPAQEVDYLSELIRVYMDYGLSEKNRTTENTVRFIDVQLGQIVDSLSLAGQNFTDFRSKKGIVDLSQEAGLVVEKLKDLESEKALAERRLEYFRNLKDYMGDAEQMKRVVSPSVIGIVDAGLNAQVVKLGELYSRRSYLSFVAKEKNPSIMMLNQEISNTLKSLGENVKNLLNNAEVELRSLSSRMDKINLELASLPKTEQEMISIKRRFDLNNELYTFLLKKRAEAAITTASNVSDARVLDVPRIETSERVGPKTAINLLIGFFLGLTLPFLGVVLSSFFDDRIQSKEELGKESNLPLLGEIVHNNYKNEMSVVDHPRSAIAESFRELRTNLQYMFSGELKKVVAIHSMIPGEGKSFSSINLAIIFAMDSKKVLLVGCDLRKPRLHLVFDDGNTKGLSTYLIKNHQFSEIVNQTRIQNLSFVNSGPIPPNPAELIGNGEFERFIAEAKKEYDYIVLDNAPVTLVTDGILAGKHADVNLFVLRQDYSRKNQIKFINQLAEKGSLKQIGMILNDVKLKSNGYGSNYGYGNGYYEEDDKPEGWRQKLLAKFSKN